MLGYATRITTLITVSLVLDRFLRKMYATSKQ